MNLALIAAAGLTILTGIIHSWLGEVRLIGPLCKEEMRVGILERRYARDLLRVGWHITTLAWWSMAAVMVVIALRPAESASHGTLLAFGITFAVMGIISLVVGRGRHLSWAAFLAIAALLLAQLA